MARKPTPCGQRIQPLFARSEMYSREPIGHCVVLCNLSPARTGPHQGLRDPKEYPTASEARICPSPRGRSLVNGGRQFDVTDVCNIADDRQPLHLCIPAIDRRGVA